MEIYFLIVAAASVIVALCALYVAVDQGVKVREHNRISLRPFLVFEVDLTVPENEDGSLQDKECGVYLFNAGIGPGVIKSVNLTFEEENFDVTTLKGWINYFNRAEIGSQGEQVHCYQMDSDFPLGSGEKRGVVWFKTQEFEDDRELGEKIIGNLNKTTFFVEYESFYGEPFEVGRRAPVI